MVSIGSGYRLLGRDQPSLPEGTPFDVAMSSSNSFCCSSTRNVTKFPKRVHGKTPYDSSTSLLHAGRGFGSQTIAAPSNAQSAVGGRCSPRSCTAWCSEIGSLTSLDACNSGASSDFKEPISLHQAVDLHDQLFVFFFTTLQNQCAQSMKIKEKNNMALVIVVAFCSPTSKPVSWEIILWSQSLSPKGNLL